MKNVVYKMKHGSHAEATELLARLRTGESVEQLNDIWKGHSSTEYMRQTSRKSRNERKSARVNDAMRSAYHLSTGPNLTQRTLFSPRINASPSGYGDPAEITASVLHQYRLSNAGLPFQPQMQLESELLTCSVVDHNLEASELDPQDRQALLPGRHLSRPLDAGDVGYEESHLNSQTFQGAILRVSHVSRLLRPTTLRSWIITLDTTLKSLFLYHLF